MVEKDSTARTRELGHRMKEFRQLRRMSGADVSRRNGWLQSKVTRWEQGLRELSVVDAALYLATAGEAGAERDCLLELAQSGNELYWVRPYFDDLVDPMKSLIIQENLATCVVTYEPLVIPGLLQIESYARAVFELVGNRTRKQLDLVVEARLDRQRTLLESSPPQCTFFIHERALRSVVGSLALMHEQLLHLVIATNLPQYSIRVVPASNEMGRALDDSFVVMEFADHPAVVFTETYVAGVFIDDRVAVEVYFSLVARLEGDSLNEGESRRLLAQLADEYERTKEQA